MKELAINKYFTQSGCLTLEALEKFSSGNLPEKDIELLRAHIDECELCSDSLMGVELLQNKETLKKTISKINQNLNEKLLNKNAKGQSSKYSGKLFYFSAAASILILIGVLFYLNFSANKLSSDNADFIVQENIKMPIPPTLSVETQKKADRETKIVKKKNSPKSVQDPILEKLQHITINFSEIEDDDFFDEDLEISIDKSENIHKGKSGSKDSGSPEGFLIDMVVINSGNNKKNGPSAPTQYLQMNEEFNTEKNAKKEQEEVIFMAVETMPQFPGGEAGLRNYLQKNLRYPSKAREASVEGKVYISFVVNSAGKVTDTKVIRGIGEACNEEALQVITEMPFWKPATQQGRLVSVRFVIPVYFKLN